MFLGRLGSKLIGGVKFGGSLLSKAARIGGNIATGVGRAMDSVSRIPMLAPATGHPAFQAMRGVVAGAARIGKMAGHYGTIAQGVARRAERETGLRGDHTVKLFQNKTSQGATGRQSLGQQALLSTVQTPYVGGG